MQILPTRAFLCSLLLAVVACGGQTISEAPADSGPGEAHQDSPDAASTATTEPDDSGTINVGPNDATPVQPMTVDASVPSSDCLSICEGKAAACGAPSGPAEMDCTAMCAASPSPAQLACIQSGSCANLAATFEDAGTVCGIGQQDGG